MKKSSNAHIKAAAKYNAAKTVQLPLRLNIHTDADIIEQLNSAESKQGYIKRLIREDIAKRTK